MYIKLVALRSSRCATCQPVCASQCTPQPVLQNTSCVHSLTCSFGMRVPAAIFSSCFRMCAVSRVMVSIYCLRVQKRFIFKLLLVASHLCTQHCSRNCLRGCIRLSKFDGSRCRCRSIRRQPREAMVPVQIEKFRLFGTMFWVSLR